MCSKKAGKQGCESRFDYIKGCEIEDEEMPTTCDEKLSSNVNITNMYFTINVRTCACDTTPEDDLNKKQKVDPDAMLKIIENVLKDRKVTINSR